MARPIKPPLVVAALIFACLGYAPGLAGPFVHDDFTNLDAILVPINSWAQALDAILSNGSGMLRRPLANASLVANHILFGDTPFEFKLVNLLLHAACGAAIYATGNMAVRVRTQLTSAIKTPTKGMFVSSGLILFIAAIWLAHPLSVSTVLYVVQRMTVLSALFTLLALWTLMHGLNGSRPWLSVVLFYLSTLLAVASKENGALTPVYALALVLLVGQGHLRQIIQQNRFLLTATIVIPIVAGIVLTLMGFDRLEDGFQSRDFTLPQRIASETVILWQYAFNIFVPLPGAMQFFRDDAPIRNIGDISVLLSASAWLLIAAWATRRYRSDPWPAFALLWYLGGHAMESSFIALDLAYEHRNYLPMLGPLAAVAAAACNILKSNTRLPLRTAGLLALACLLTATAARAYTWSSLPRLVSHELSAAPNSLRAQYYGYFVALTKQDWSVANAHLASMHSLDPGSGWIDTNVLLSRCYGDPGAIVDGSVLERISADAADERTRRGLQQVLSLNSSGSCRLPLGFDLRNFLKLLAHQTEKESAAVAADYYYMTSSMAWNEGDLSSSARLLEKSASLSPTNSRPAEQLIVVQLAIGDTNAARRALEQAVRIWGIHEPWRNYRRSHWLYEIEEVERQLNLPDSAQNSSNELPDFGTTP